MTFTRTSSFALSAVAASMFCSQAVMAQSAVTAPAAAAVEVAYNAGLVTDYRYRGISQTRLQPALQGGADLTYGAWYAGVWASNVKWIKDSGGKGNAEIDLYGGYKYALTSDVTLDLGVLAYQYPSNQLPTSANTTELYVGVASGPYSAKYSQATSNLFGFANSKGSNYLEFNIDYELVKGTNFVGHLGRQNVKNNVGASYTDYKVGVTHEVLGGKLAASVIGANEDYFAPNGKNISKAGLVLGFSKSF